MNQSSAFTAASVVAARMGNAHPSIAPYDVLPTADGDIAVAVGNDRQFQSLCDVLGAPHWTADARFASNESRIAHRVELRRLLEERLAARPSAAWATALSDAGVPAGKVNDIGEAFALADRLGLEPVVEIDRPDGGLTRLPRNPIRLSATPVTYRSAPPAMGAP